MQQRQSSIHGDRPQCPVDLKHRVHSHGHYRRYKNADGVEKESVSRWLCTACCGTISIVADTRLPYRPIETDQLEGWFDAIFTEGRAPPPATEKEKGCMERAVTRFLQHIPSLVDVLGQMTEIVSPTASQLWMELRKFGKLGKILRVLSETFKTSLLGDYRCLHPWRVSG